MRKKLISVLLSAAMVLSLFVALPVTVSATESYDAEIYVADGTGTGDGWSFASGEIWINEDGSYFVYGGGTETGNRIRVKTGVTASVTLDNVNINVALPFEVSGTANVIMILKDGSVNTFRSGGGHAGIRVQSSATLTITTAGQSLGDGALSAYGSADGGSSWASAGIGGSELEASGTIVIDGGTIFAKGGDGRTPGAWRGPGAAGIGGAQGRACGDITINGGTVMAFGGGVNPEGAGIGGGSSDPASYAGKITINGGTVRAYSGQPSGGDSASGTGIGFCASIAIADTADVQAYSSGNHPTICGTVAASGHTAYLQNFTLDARVLSDTDMTITQIDDDTETFEMTLPANYKNFAATVGTDNGYTAALSDGSKKVVSLADESAEFPGICDLPGTELSSVNVRLKAEPVCMIDTVEYETLGEALANVADGGTIKLLANLNHSNSISADNRVLSIDLNGFDLTMENVAGHALEAKNNGVLNISDEDGDGVLTVNSSGEYKHCVNAVSGGTVNIKGNLTAAISTGAPSYQNVIGAYADGAGSAINLIGNTTGHMAGAYSQNGAVITITGDVGGAYYGAYSAYNSSVDITGNVSGSRALVAEYGGQTMVEGDITGSQYAIDATSGTGWDAPIVRVTGNVTGVGGAAISASNEADIQVTGDVTGYIAVTGSTDTCPDVTISGDIAVSGGFGVSVFYGGTVTVNGRIVGATPYLKLNNLSIAQGDYNEISGNYYKYANLTTDTPAPYAANTVYVAKPLDHGTLQFEASSHGTYEGYHGGMIGVERISGSDGEVSVSYAMADGTAVAGTNYVAYSGTLTWADGDSSRKVIMFTSHNDSVYSGYLTLTCTLSDPTGGAVLGGQNPLDIQISDNDAPPAPTGLTAAAGSGRVTLSWNSVKDAYYQVYCSQTSGSFTEANLINSVYDGTSYTVTSLTPGHTYYFAVKAGHNIYYSDFSETASAVPTGGGTSGGSSPSTSATPTYNADVTAGGGAQTTLPVTVDKDSGTASVDTGSGKLTSDGTVITMPQLPNLNTYSVGIPVPDLSTTGVQGTLTLDTDAGSVTIPSNMLTDTEGVNGDKAQITIGAGDKSTLPDDVKIAIGDKPLIQLTLSIDGKQTGWSNPNAPVTVSIPYTPTAAELANPESIVIWYIDGAGNVVTIPNSHYNAATGTVTFSTTHFSDYAVAFNEVSFNDVAASAWYSKAVSFIAARKITSGTGDGTTYSPEAKLTRGEFIVLMMRAYGIAPDANPTGNFSDASNTYYTSYLAAAKRLGITAGIGNNMYAPGKEITRQEMFTLLYNALKVIGQLPQGDTGKTLSDFTDVGQIDSWAQEAMSLLVKTGTIGGSNGKLTPTGTTTRAEMAQVLYNLLGK